MKNAAIYTILLALTLLPSGMAACTSVVCGNDTYQGEGNLAGMTWATIEGIFTTNYAANDRGWNLTQTFSNGSLDILWVPWASSSDPSEAALKDTYTQSAYGINANWANNSAISDEASEWLVASAMNLSYTQLTQYMNYMRVCRDDTVAHTSYGPYLTSWACTRLGNITHGNITENDENSASDATARFALGFFMAAQDPDHTAGQRAVLGDWAMNISRASAADEWVTACWNSTVNSSATLCTWRLAGAGQAWGGGALTQVGQQMFLGYHEADVQANLAACAYSGNRTFCDLAANETHQFLYVVGYRGGSASANFNISTGGAHYYMNCTGIAGCTARTQSTSKDWDDADAPRAWEMCNVVRHARTTYSNLSLSLPWEFGALENYCAAWNTRMTPNSTIIGNGTQLASLTGACYRISNGSNCSDVGIIGLNSYFGAGLVSNMVAYGGNASFWNTFVNGSLRLYNTTGDAYQAEPVFGIYNQVRYLKSIRAATQYYDYVYMNDTYNRTAYEQGYPAAAQGGGDPPVEESPASVSASCDDVVGGLARLAIRMPGLLALVIAMAFFSILGVGVASGMDAREMLLTAGGTVAILAVALATAYSTIGGLC